jgi:hypothetical protein
MPRIILTLSYSVRQTFFGGDELIGVTLGTIDITDAKMEISQPKESELRFPDPARAVSNEGRRSFLLSCLSSVSCCRSISTAGMTGVTQQHILRHSSNITVT